MESNDAQNLNGLYLKLLFSIIIIFFNIPQASAKKWFLLCGHKYWGKIPQCFAIREKIILKKDLNLSVQ